MPTPPHAISRLADRLPPWAAGLSGGCILIIVAGLIAAPIALTGGTRASSAMQLWLFAATHEILYQPMVDEWNADAEARGALPIEMSMLGLAPLQRRVMSGFYGGLPTADLVEIERTMAGQVFSGPVEAVGLVDLTDRMRDAGMFDKFPETSLSPWTSRGRVFGIPHDVHPLLLGVRADLVEGAGISLDNIETWDDFARTLAPMMRDDNNDGDPDRYLLGFWPTQTEKVEILLLQGGTGLFDENGALTLVSEANARVLATMVSWCVGPNRIAADVKDFEASGNKLKTDGFALAFFMPDWMCNVWKNELPHMAGTLEIMPLPAFEPGGRRVSVWGGTMLGIPKTSQNIDAAWDAAQHLYFDSEFARELYRAGDIITPINTYWADPVFDEPDDYFRGQAKGRLYIEHIPGIPARNASPYNQTAVFRVADAAMALIDYANDNALYTPAELEAEAMNQLQAAERAILRVMNRNAFAQAEPAEADTAESGTRGGGQ